MYKLKTTIVFMKEFKLIQKRGKDIEKLKSIVKKLARGEKLEEKYRNHELSNSKRFKDCIECHIESDWLLVYQIKNEELILVLVETGSHSDLF